ncbi:MAG: chemotaxis protein CheW [Magnetococcus sp. MYC-9]
MRDQPHHDSQPEGSEYLIVNLTDTLYGVDARQVREVIRLPEVTPLEDAPHFIIGVINLRGRVVPVLDLNSRLGHLPQERYLLSDAVVVLEQGDLLLGLLVNEVREVVSLTVEDWEMAPLFEALPETPEAGMRRYRFVQGVAKLEDDLVMLLATEHLLHVQPSDWTGQEQEESGGEGVEGLTPRRRFNPVGDTAALPVFHERARRLRQQLDQQAMEERVSLAIVRLHGELLGVDLRGVSGFTRLSKVTPVPCCPAHIAGSMNLRGEVLVLVDVRQILNLTTTGSEQGMEKAVIVSLGQYEVGVLVHEVVDVIHIQQTDMAATPTAASALRGEHLQGAVPYGKQMLGILNIQAILADPALLVNEEV